MKQILILLTVASASAPLAAQASSIMEWLYAHQRSIKYDVLDSRKRNWYGPEDGITYVETVNRQKKNFPYDIFTLAYGKKNATSAKELTAAQK